MERTDKGSNAGPNVERKVSVDEDITAVGDCIKEVVAMDDNDIANVVVSGIIIIRCLDVSFDWLLLMTIYATIILYASSDYMAKQILSQRMP